MIQISSKADGFRRCGIAHPATPTDYPDDRFTDEQLKELASEPMLVVAVLGDDISGVSGNLNAKETIKLVQGAVDIESLDVLADGEDRKTVLEAIDVRRSELETKPTILDRDK